MNLNLLLGLLIFATALATYVFWIRPLLKQNPSFAYFFATEQSFTAATRLKLVGLKQKIVGAVLAASAFIVSAYDFIAPLVAQSGVDVTQLSAKIPAQAWPVIGLASVLLLQYLRSLSDKRAAADPIILPEVPRVQAPKV